MKNAYCILLLLLCTNLFAQVDYSANDEIIPYEGKFRPGINLGYNPPWSTSQLADLAAGNEALGIPGVGARSSRPALYESVLNIFGYDLEVQTFDHFQDLGMDDLTCIVGFPVDWHRDHTVYCDDGITESEMFGGLYEPIWDNGENGTPVNEDNLYAAYLYEVVTLYDDYIKFWEIWNEPGFDYTGNLGWRPPGYPGNWWENNPDPCDYKLKAPIFHYVRTLRISWEIIKSIAPDDYVVVAGTGYESFLDAILRNTDHPFDGTVTDDYPLKGGAYFDVMGYHSYPHFDGSLRYWSNDIGGFVYERHSDKAAEGILQRRGNFQAVLDNYGYDGITFPKKEWLITEINTPREQYDEYIGSEESQINFIMKAVVTCIQNSIHQMHVYNLGDEEEESVADSVFDLLGMYQKLGGTEPYEQVVNQEGIAYKTVSDILYDTEFDVQQTAALNLPETISGGAFRFDDGTFVYALWAKTTIDMSEAADATYSFPASFDDELEMREWDFSQTGQVNNISSQGIDLDARPIFIGGDTSGGGGGGFEATLNIACGNDINMVIPEALNGVFISWQAPVVASNCPNGNPEMTQSSGPISSSYFPIGTTVIEYKVVDQCGNESTCSFNVVVMNLNEDTDVEQPNDYCQSSGIRPWHEFIQNVNFVDINNTSFKNQYKDFTNNSTFIDPGVTYPITLTAGYSYFSYDEYFRIWIDFNQDNVFDDPEERVFSEILNAPDDGTYSGILEGNIEIPEDVNMGSTRMRIAMQRGEFPDPCGDFTYGEVEDYGVIVAAGAQSISTTDEFLYLNAEKDKGKSHINWSLNTDFKTSYFIIERSANARDFEVIADVTSESDDNAPMYYTMTDAQPYRGDNYYRIKQIFDDGTYFYSMIQKVNFNLDLENILLYPNPANNYLMVDAEDFVGKNTNFTIYNTLGLRLDTRDFDELPEQAIQFDLTNYTPGIYLLSIKVDGQRAISRKFVISD